MAQLGRIALLIPLMLTLATPAIRAGEALVIKTADGKFIPAVAKEWAQMGKSFRFLLQTGTDAATVADQLKDSLAPISVEAADALTLVFRGENLTQTALLEKLAGIELGKVQAKQDALAALAALGDEGGPSMNDFSSAVSIRASKKIDLPESATAAPQSDRVIGRVIEVLRTQPMPTLVIKLHSGPTAGAHKKLFPKNSTIVVRGYYRVHAESGRLDKTDPKTQLNFKTWDMKPGTWISGKALISIGNLWVFEIIEATQAPAK